MTSFHQRDGKLVVIDARGIAKRFLASGEEDPEPLAGVMNGEERAWSELMGRRFLDQEPLTVADIGFARPSPENVAAFNRARTEWQSACATLNEALGDTGGEALTRIQLAVDDAISTSTSSSSSTRPTRTMRKTGGFRR